MGLKCISRNHCKILKYAISILFISLCLITSSCQKGTDLIVDANILSELDNGDYNIQNSLIKYQNILSEVPEDSPEAADVYKVIGGIYAENLRDKDKALYYINKAIEIDNKENNTRGLAQDYNQMSKIYIFIGGDSQEGLRYLDEAERIYKSLGLEETLEMVETLSNKGDILYKNGDFEQAVDCLLKAQNIFKTNEKESIVLYIKSGQSYLELGLYEKANEQYLEAKRVCELVGNEYYLAEVNYQFGWLNSVQKDYKRAIQYYEQALVYYKESDDLIDEALVYNNIAWAGYRLGWEADKVLPLFVRACRTIERVSPATDQINESKNQYKSSLGQVYKAWSKDSSEDGFKMWYEEVVLNGKDWNGN